MPQVKLIAVRDEWLSAWQQIVFRKKVITGLIAVIGILSVFPLFFQRIEKRNGILLNDPLLRWLPAHDVSLIIFIIIWAVTLLMIFRAAGNPFIFLTYVWAYFFLSIMRVLTITLVPLDPPSQLVGLIDPVSNFFYGAKFVTRDLFFSGHTSAVFLMYLCLVNPVDKAVALIGTVLVGFLLLVQHVHYTLDVFGALGFAVLARWVAMRVVVKEKLEQAGPLEFPS